MTRPIHSTGNLSIFSAADTRFYRVEYNFPRARATPLLIWHANSFFFIKFFWMILTSFADLSLALAKSHGARQWIATWLLRRPRRFDLLRWRHCRCSLLHRSTASDRRRRSPVCACWIEFRRDCAFTVSISCLPLCSRPTKRRTSVSICSSITDGTVRRFFSHRNSWTTSSQVRQ